MKTNCINKIILFCIILLSAIENVMAQGHLISLSKLKNEIIYIYDFGIFKGEEYVYDRFMMEELRIINKVSFDDYAKRHPEMVNQEFYIYDDCKFPNSIIINKSDLDTINRENVQLQRKGKIPQNTNLFFEFQRVPLFKVCFLH